MKYGYFDDANREYVITDPRTPAKWINYVGTLAFGGIVDHTGGSLICKQDPALNRMLKYVPQMPDSDFKGETLFIRIKRADGSYKVFSPFYVPTLDAMDLYECRVGLSYQKITSVVYGVRTEVTIFVPPGKDVVVRDIRVTNVSQKAQEIDVIPVIEFSHFDALKQLINADWVPQTMQVDAEHQEGGRVILKQAAFMKKERQINFFTSNHAVDSFQTDREKLLGNMGYGSWRWPAELQNEQLSNYEARRGNNIAALLHKLNTLQPDDTRRIITQLGQGVPSSIGELVVQFRDESEVDTAFVELQSFWTHYLDAYQCETPDAAFNSMINVHNPRQCHTTLNWSRYLSLYQLGYGARGIGFRDSTQDVMGVLASAPKEAKDLLRKLLSVQNPDGSAMHQFFPLTMEANEGDSREEGNKRVYGDDHLWGVLAVCAYVKETGDYDFLQESITFYDKRLPLPEREDAPVFEHLKRAMAYTKANVGRHGLPLLGFADWNDTVNLPGEAESLFNANLYGTALRELIDLSTYLEDPATATALEADWESMRESVNTHAWDGEWYTRYFKEDGEPIGSRHNDEGRIFTNGQSWPVISGFATEDRAKTALDSVYTHLNTVNGIKLSGPGYTRFDPEKGGVSTYPPGAKENGGIFLHSNPWVMIAETKLGNGDRAFEYYSQINPAGKNDQIETYEVEPYCYAQNILGDEHPQFGLGRNSWLSGTASWTYQAATQYILGIRPSHHGLIVDPCIPKSWNVYNVVRQYRGATYEFQVKNPENINKGVTSILLDGQPLETACIPQQPTGSRCKVEVIMGSLSPLSVEEPAPSIATTPL
ncbi:MAG TPA: glycosyl transferase [Opitutae bacterium]|nr:glycosyl transferase [Opitutae bacterium]